LLDMLARLYGTDWACEDNAGRAAKAACGAGEVVVWAAQPGSASSALMELGYADARLESVKAARGGFCWRRNRSWMTLTDPTPAGRELLTTLAEDYASTDVPSRFSSLRRGSPVLRNTHHQRLWASGLYESAVSYENVLAERGRRKGNEGGNRLTKQIQRRSESESSALLCYWRNRQDEQHLLRSRRGKATRWAWHYAQVLGGDDRYRHDGTESRIAARFTCNLPASRRAWRNLRKPRRIVFAARTGRFVLSAAMNLHTAVGFG